MVLHHLIGLWVKEIKKSSNFCGQPNPVEDITTNAVCCNGLEVMRNGLPYAT